MTFTRSNGHTICLPNEHETLSLWRESQELEPELGPVPFEEYFQAYLEGSLYVIRDRCAGTIKPEINPFGTWAWAVASQNIFTTYSWLSHIYVSPPVRRRGVATALLEQVEQRGPVALGVHADNYPAIEMYEKRGYGLITGYRYRGDYWWIMASLGGSPEELHSVYG